jgi:hypothetical protein
LDLLFYNRDLYEVLDGLGKTAEVRVNQISEERFANTDNDVLIQLVVDQCEVVPIEIYENRKQMEQSETKVLVNDFGRGIYVDGLQVVVSIPYTGTRELWNLKPSTWQSVFPKGIVSNQNKDGIGHLDIFITQPSAASEESFKNRLERELSSIRFFLKSQKQDIEEFNANLPSKVQEFVERRKDKLTHHKKIIEFLDIPLKQREDAPDVKNIPIKRKLVRPLPPIPDKPQEHGIRPEDYEHILSVIRYVGRTFETTPSTYSIHPEEELRDIILANLNGHYKGDAGGETFRRKGKTDINIDFEGRAAFVAECKVWHGDKKLMEALDQLIGYLTWRDCKASIIIFNRDIAGFSEIQKKIPIIIESHQNCLTSLTCNEVGEWRYQFRSIEDKDRQIIIHVFLFDLYVGKKDL